MKSVLNRNIGRIFIVAFLMAAICAGMFAGSRRDDSARRKARYYYLEGARSQAEGRQDEAYEYYRKAYKEDPTYSEAGYNVGSVRLYFRDDTLQSETELNRSLSFMEAYVRENPGEANEAMTYAHAASYLGRSDEALEILGKTSALDPGNSNVLALISDIHGGRNDFRPAIDALKKYIEIEGNSLAAGMRLMSYMLADGDTLGAVGTADEMIALNPLDPSYVIIKGNLYDVINRPDSALRMYLHAEEIAPESGLPKIALAEYYHQQDDSVKYDEKLYDALLAEDLEYEQKHELLANYLQELLSGKQDTSRGDYLFGVLRDRYPHLAQLRDLAARYAAAKGEYAQAAEEISYAIDQDPTNDTYWGQLMSYLNLAEKPDEALDAFDKAKAYITPNESLKALKSMIALKAKKYDVAIGVYAGMIRDIDSTLSIDRPVRLKDVRKDISLDGLDKLSSLYASIGDVWHAAGNLDSTFMAYDTALDLDDQNWMALNNYAYFLTLDDGDLDKALGMIERVMHGPENENPTYLDTYAWVLHKKGMNEEALVEQQKALDFVKERELYDSPEYHDHLAEILMALGRPEEAVAEWQKALELEPDDTEAILKKINQALGASSK